MLQRTIRAAAFVTIALGSSNISTGQPPASPEWTVVTTTQIKPEFRAEYEAGQKEIAAAFKKAGVPYRIVVQTLLGDLSEYTSIAPISKLADMDEPNPLVKALGEPASARLLKRLGSYLMTAHRTTTLAMPDISINTPVENQADYAQVSVMRLRPGKAAEFISFMKDDYLPVMKKVDVGNLWVSRPIFGGDLNERVMVRPIRKFAELDGGPLTTKALGAEGARKLAEKQGAIVESTRFSIVRLRKDLSYMPPRLAPKAGE